MENDLSKSMTTDLTGANIDYRMPIGYIDEASDNSETNWDNTNYSTYLG